MQTPPELLDREASELAGALGAQYELVRLIGRGGMGRVYLAHERFLDRDVAVKVLPAELAEGGDARERFLREARTAARLSHANIVPLYTFGQSGELLYFIMGYVAGESLESLLRRERRLPIERARRILAELADALDYAHSAGVIHRDLKPDNVLIDGATGRAMLADFGIAKRVSSETLTQTGMLMGTPHYMSPEQAAGDRGLDGRSDIYALGIIGYRMITGRLPFDGEHVQDVLTQHLTRRQVPVSQFVPDVPIEVANVIERALEKDPSSRWPSGRMMRDAVRGETDESTPDDLRQIQDIGVRTILIGAAMAAGAFLTGLYGVVDPVAASVIAACGVLPPAIGVGGTLLVNRKFSTRVKLAAIFRQPTWWAGWWPTFGRRAGDVWERLPAPVRRFRQMGLIFGLACIPMTGFMLYIMRPEYLVTRPRTGMVPVILLVPLFATMTWFSLRHRAWRKGTTLSKVDSLRMLNEPTFRRSFWERPDIAEVLAPAPPSEVQALMLDTPEGMLREMRTILGRDSTSPHADVYREAADAGARLVKEIAAVEGEMSRLASQVDPAERSRIQSRLDALGASAEMQEMRALLSRQLGIFSELESRIAELTTRRNRLVDHLRLLALQVAQLHAVSDQPDSTEITQRVRSLCRRIEDRSEATAALEAELSLPRTTPA